jgi:undecaprenyl diphosphate synthase
VADSQKGAEVVPAHIGIILDGNRRWAKAQGLPKLQGHRHGYDNIRPIALAAADRGVKYMSAYIFSTENWERSQEEVDFLMDLFIWVASKEIDKYVSDGFRLVFLGSRERLSPKLVEAMEAAEAKTAHNTRMTAALCLNYGGQLELAEGVARLVADGVPAAEVTPERLASYMYHPEIPPVDLLIRTSGEQRLSGFMLWRSTYSELYFSNKFWPDFSVADMEAALDEYARRQRRFGR